MTYDQWKTTDPNDNGDPPEETQSELEYVYDLLSKRNEQIADLVKALEAVVDNVNDYERVNNLSPNPGRTECWDSVARAKAVLANVAASLASPSSAEGRD